MAVLLPKPLFLLLRLLPPLEQVTLYSAQNS